MSAPRRSASEATSDKTAAMVLAVAVSALASSGQTARLDAELLLAFATGRSRASLLAFPERSVGPAAAAKFAALVARRVRGEPLAYLTGRQEFFSLPLEVTPAVLVPRPETELLVELALARCAARAAPALLDVGTGSGAIALALKHERSDATVTGVDVSREALAVAAANAARLNLDLRWLESSWFAALGDERFDVVVSNPPDGRSGDVRGALDFEPRLALDGGDDGLNAYRELFAGATSHLETGGALLLEHGNEQRPALIALAAVHGWNVAAAHDDLAGHARVLVLEWSAA